MNQDNARNYNDTEEVAIYLLADHCQQYQAVDKIAEVKNESKERK